MSATVVEKETWRPTVASVYIAGAGVALIGFAAAGVLLAATLPFHQWDSFAFADWSRAIAADAKVDPIVAGPQSAARPLYFELQGGLWAITGVSFTAARLLSLAFALVLVLAVATIPPALGRSRLEGALAAAVVIAVPTFAGQSLSAQTDVPAAAMVALTAALVLRMPTARTWLVATGAAAALAVVTKQSTLLALVPLAAVLLARSRRGAPLALAAGLAVGLAYDWVMASRFDTGLVTFLREGTGGIWAQLASQARGNAVRHADVLGAGLRVPLLFGLAYALARLVRAPHRYATGIGLAVAIVWSLAGASPFARSEEAFTFVGFVLVIAGGMFLAEDVPTRWSLLVATALGLPSLLVWVWTTVYTDRLAATAWPGLAVLIALVLGTTVRGLGKLGWPGALLPVPVIAAAVWMSVSGLDGLHGTMWQEYRSLGWGGLGDKERTMHVVLPAFQSTLATAESQLGDGRLVSGEPMFPWFLPGRTVTATPAACADLRGYRVFVLLTGDESELAAREAGRLATPEQWAACPGVHQLTDGGNGYAVFAIG